MVGSLALIAGLLAPFLGGSTSPVVTPAEFRAWFDAARVGKVAAPVDRGAGRYRYVFIGGLGNERMPGYFAQNAQELRSLGVRRDRVHYIWPSSRSTIEENADGVRDRLRAIAAEGPEPIVVIAHSRGACDALAFALREPAFVREKVAALFLIQGPFGGSALADRVGGNGPAMDRRMPLRFRVVAYLAARVERRVMERGRHAGLADLTREASRRFWSRMIAEHRGAIAEVGPRVFFLRTEATPSGLGAIGRAFGSYLTTYDGPNDGVVAVRDQYLPGLGTSLGVVDGGHADLTRRKRSTATLRRALIRSLVMVLRRADPAGD